MVHVHFETLRSCVSADSLRYGTFVQYAKIIIISRLYADRAFKKPTGVKYHLVGAAVHGFSQ